MNVEVLGQGSDGKVSSQPVIKSGNNRGRRKAEKGGAWIFSGGYCYEDSQEAKSAHGGWIKAIWQLGYRVGSYDGLKQMIEVLQHQLDIDAQK